MIELIWGVLGNEREVVEGRRKWKMDRGKQPKRYFRAKEFDF